MAFKCSTAVEGGEHSHMIRRAAIPSLLESNHHGLAVAHHMRAAIEIMAVALAAFSQYALLEGLAAVIGIGVEQFTVFTILRLKNGDKMYLISIHLHPFGITSIAATHIVDVTHRHIRRGNHSLGILPRLAPIGRATIVETVITIGIGFPVGPGHMDCLS